jgi:hypothetical protein
MSQFDFPRIHVKGEFYFNPGTANNDSIDPTDEGTVTAITETVQPVNNGMTDEDFKIWLASLDPKLNILNGQWNIYGDMSYWFDTVLVNSVQTNPETVITNPLDFPIIGCQVAVNNAFALDVDPEGFSTTQLFCDSFSLKGTEEALGKKNVWFSRKPSRGATRWINWYRNLSYHGLPGSSGAAGGVSAMWQMAFPVLPEDLDPANKVSNPNYLDGNLRSVYNQFPETNANGFKLKGMLFRMNLYLCYPLISDTDLYNNYFAKGIAKENPAIGRTVGTFAPWYEEEMKSITLKRYLNSANSYSNPYSSNPFPRNQAYLGPVVASVNKEKKVVSLDLINTFPEDGAAGVKFEMGTATLQVQMPDGSVEKIGNFDYDQNSYELTSGLADVKFDDNQSVAIESGLLAISLSNYNQGPLLLENEYMIATDTSCAYLNEDKSKNREITVKAVYKGEPLKEPVTIDIEQWQMTPTSAIPNMPVMLGSTKQIVPVESSFTFNLATLNGPGVRVFRFVPPVFKPARLNIITDFMSSVRVLPKSDYSWVKDEDLNFDLIYREIFRYYYLVLPAMNKRLPMNDPTIWNTPTAAEYVLKRSEEARWEDFEYMPRTRDLSDDRRDLLHRFLKKTLAEKGGPLETHL